MTGYIGEVWGLIERYQVLQAFLVNLELTAICALASLVLGTILVIMRVCPAPSLQIVARFSTDLMLNLPLTLIIVACSMVLWGQLGFEFSDNLKQNNFWLAVLGLSLYTSAFVAESLRSGINTVDVGQSEAARSIGLSFTQSLHQVLLPQAFRAAVAPLGNTLVALAKNTTVAFAIGVSEASNAMLSMLEMRADLILSIFALIAIGWLIIVLPLGIAATWLSRKMAGVK